MMKYLESKRQRWMIAGIVGLFCLCTLVFCQRRTTVSDGQSYKEYTVQKGDLSVSILTTGTVQPKNRLDIKVPIPGRIDSVLVAEGEMVKKGQLLAWMSSTERAALVDAARAQGPEEVKKWEDLFRSTSVIAPISGLIIQRRVEPGQTFASTDHIFVMADRLTVKANVDETDMAKVKLGQTAELVLDAYSDQTIPAKVDHIAYEATTVNNVTTYVIDVLPDDTPEFMRTGMTANVTFNVDTKKDILLIPTEAINLKDGEMSVKVKLRDGVVVDRPVKLGVSDGKQTEVLSGVSDGETILIRQIDPKNKNKATANPFSGRPSGSKKR